MKNSIKSIGLASLISIGAAGCSDTNPTVLYNGKIGDDEVTLTYDNNGLDIPLQILNIRKPDERTITFQLVDSHTPWIKTVEIIKSGKTNTYTFNDIAFMEGAKKYFDYYLESIRQTNVIKGLQKNEEDKESYSARQKKGLEDLK